MERELGKTLMEIEHMINMHERKGNTHTQSVLEQAREIIGMCTQAARTPSDLKEILERDTAMKINEIHVDEYYCPACGAENNCDQGVVEDNFCPRCGQRLKSREEQP